MAISFLWQCGDNWQCGSVDVLGCHSAQAAKTAYMANRVSAALSYRHRVPFSGGFASLSSRRSYRKISAPGAGIQSPHDGHAHG
jgi:hypothetical protein